MWKAPGGQDICRPDTAHGRTTIGKATSPFPVPPLPQVSHRCAPGSHCQGGLLPPLPSPSKSRPPPPRKTQPLSTRMKKAVIKEVTFSDGRIVSASLSGFSQVPLTTPGPSVPQSPPRPPTPAPATTFDLIPSLKRKLEDILDGDGTPEKKRIRNFSDDEAP